MLLKLLNVGTFSYFNGHEYIGSEIFEKCLKVWQEKSCEQ